MKSSAKVNTSTAPDGVAVCCNDHMEACEGSKGIGIYKIQNKDTKADKIFALVGHVGLNSMIFRAICSNSKGHILALCAEENKLLVLSSPPSPVVIKEILLVDETKTNYFEDLQYMSVNCVNDDIIILM